MEIAYATPETVAWLDPASVSILPHCWAQYNDVHCRKPSLASPTAALQAGWTVLQVSLTSVPSRPAAFGTTLLVPICPEHHDIDMVDAAFWLFGLHTPVWDAAIPALDPQRVQIHRDCPECQHIVAPDDWIPADPLPAGCHAVYVYTADTDVEGHLTIACPAHTYALWDYTLCL